MDKHILKKEPNINNPLKEFTILFFFVAMVGYIEKEKLYINFEFFKHLFLSKAWLVKCLIQIQRPFAFIVMY